LLSAIFKIRTCSRFEPNAVRQRSRKATARRASEASYPARPTNAKKRPKGAFLLSAIPEFSPSQIWQVPSSYGFICRYACFMARGFKMTTIQTSTPSVQTGSSGGSSSGASGIASQISRLTSQITKLTQQLKDVANGSGSTEDKKKQQELLQAQIKMLQAQLAQLQRQQAEEAQQKQDQKQGKIEGVNSPSADHQIDIYI
jgi:hypothetical protein